MATNIFSSITFFGHAGEQQRLIADIEDCLGKYQEGGWCDLRHLIPLSPADDKTRVNGLVRDLTVYREPDEITVACVMRKANIGELFLHISTGYPGLAFRYFESEQIYESFDATFIFRDGKIIVDEVHEADCPQSFFDNAGQVIKPGYTVIAADGSSLVYRRKDIVMEEDYDSRCDKPDEMNIEVEDTDGTVLIVPMNSVKRHNKWDAYMGELKKKLSELSGMKFPHGQVVATRCVQDLMAADAEFSRFVSLSLTRHLHGDWGSVCDEDRVANELALQDGERLHSVYRDNGWQIWIMTEADRSATTVMFPLDY